MLKKHYVSLLFVEGQGAFLVVASKVGQVPNKAFQGKFLRGGWQNNAPKRGREAYFQEFGIMSHGNTTKLEGSMEKS